jgi:hypothetical protein
MKLFLSYPHKDADKAKALGDLLTRSGQTVWFDEQLRTGPRWQDQLTEQIREADAIVLALTPAWLDSPYCQWEFITAAEQGKKVIPVLLANQPDGERLVVPNRISQYQWADFSMGFDNTTKVQKFLDDVLALAVSLKQSDVSDMNKEALAMKIDEENKKGHQTTISGGQVGAINNYGSQTNTFSPQTNQTTQSGNNVSTSGNNNTVAGGNIDQSRHNNSNIRIGGSVQGGNVNIGGDQTVHGNVTITMRDMTQTIQKGTASPSDKEQLQQLLDQLKAALAAVPAEHQESAGKIAKRTEELVAEVSETKPDKDGVEGKANLLLKAAQNIKEALPEVFAIAGAIVTFGLRFAGVGL